MKTNGRPVGAMFKAACAGLCLAAALSMTGCGGTIYAIKASSASSALETAQALGAEQLAPYEYYYAYEHLWKAMEEAATADYGDAIDFADTADDYAEKAIELSKRAHGGSSR